MAEGPSVSRVYHSAFLDSTHWNYYKPRRGDIVISTSLKAGTTWMQRICAALVFQSVELHEPIDATSPWLDMRSSLPEIVQPVLAAQTHRRFLKSHLPLDATPYYEQVKYIVVARDARDVFMSMVPHHNNISPEQILILNTRDGAERIELFAEMGKSLGSAEKAAILNMQPWTGEEIPTLEHCDIHEVWKMWMTRSLFPWEEDGYPYWSHFYHLNSWWQYKHLPNILFVHYADLLSDLDGQMRRISTWLDIGINEEIWDSLVNSATFSSMKRQHKVTAPAVTHGLWKDSNNFFHKGTNGRWRDVLTAEDLQLYEDTKSRKLGPDALYWLEQGSLVSGYPGDG
jgi:aryl sulfotransferase